MRSLGLVAMLALAAPAAAAPKSDPAFLGVGMHDASPTGPCLIDSVTPGSGAEAGGLRLHDTILAINRIRIETCVPSSSATGNNLLEAVTSHERGEWVTIDVLDLNGQPRSLKVQLPSRGEILQRRLTGKRLDGLELTTVANPAQHLDLADTHGRATIVGWFSPMCSDCAYVFGKLAARPGGHSTKTQAAQTLAVTTFENSDPSLWTEKGKQLQKAIDVPLALSDLNAFQTLTINDPERITFMVLDCRGLVQYVAPIAPNSDDLDAALDELYAAADQARTMR